ncbi:MAG: PhzF family phenazine biosynthesis protein [Rhodospirillales bacterium]|nr:PhzF family phenazine biosynthesis protein [Rhodospirillales bacterium]
MTTGLALYQIDAFTDSIFRGNPAAIVPLDRWLADEVMQRIAAENNLSETAFFVAEGGAGHYRLRWFTPKAEAKLCGHATLATAWLIFERMAPEAERLNFETLSGPLGVTRDDGLLVMDFPSLPGKPCPPPEGLTAGLGRTPERVLVADKYLAVFGKATEIAAIAPDFVALERLGRGVAVTAPGDDCDCVSRYFAPHVGILEDPVTGSAHCTVIPYWAGRLGKTRIHARQVSARGGELFCELAGDRVRMGGRAVLYLEGRITV